MDVFYPVQHRHFPLPSFDAGGHFCSSVARVGSAQEASSVALWLKQGAMASIGSSSLGELYSKCVQMVPRMILGALLDRC